MSRSQEGWFHGEYNEVQAQPTFLYAFKEDLLDYDT